MSQAIIDLVKNCYAAFGRGDIATILALLADDVEWTTPGEGIPTRALLRTGGSTWNFTTFEPREYLSSGDAVVATGRYAGTARATGRAVEAEWAMVWKMRGGKVVYLREYADTETLAAAAA